MPEEIITLYTKENPSEPVACERTEYYDNDSTKYKNHYPALIDVFLFNKYGDVLLQKRGRAKRFNPGKLHTTVGGHINWGERPEFSLVHECMEELGAPALLFSSDEYGTAYKKLSAYADHAALMYEVKEYFRNYSDHPIESCRTIKDRMWLYFGRYDGPIETPDRASAGYEWMDLMTLRAEIQKNPAQFTDGLMIYVEEFAKEMDAFVKMYCSETGV